MVSINPNFQGRVAGKPKTIATPQQEDPQPQVQIQQPQTPAQPQTPVQLQQATLDNESMLAFKGIQINKPEKPEQVDDGVSLEESYKPETYEEYMKLRNSGKLQEGDMITLPDGMVLTVYRDQVDGCLWVKVVGQSALPEAK